MIYNDYLFVHVLNKMLAFDIGTTYVLFKLIYIYYKHLIKLNIIIYLLMNSTIHNLSNVLHFEFMGSYFAL